MSADLVEAVQAGEGAALGALDRTLVRAAEELVDERCLSEETWNALAKTYGIAQLIEVVFTVGAFTMLSMATNSFGMPLDGTGQP
jgi:4-carboxymuconolactone decarboxylase